MKYLVAILFSVFILLSCRTNSSQVQGSNQSKDSLNAAQTLIKKFNPILYGNWVLLDYINDLKKTYSPFSSKEKAEYIIIDTNKRTGDKIPFLYGYGSEGIDDSYTLHFKIGIAPNSIVVIRNDNIEYNLGYKIAKNDTFLILYQFDSSGNKIVSQKEYQKVKTDLKNIEKIPGTNNGGLEYFDNKILISGTYYYSDSLNNKNTICFTDFGKVTGFENFKNYYIENIFGHGPGSDEDMLYFDFDLHSQKDFSYKIHNDTIDLIELKESPNYDTIYSRTLKYRLVRQK